VIPSDDHTTLVVEQGKCDIATALPFESTTLPAEGLTVDPDGTSMAHPDCADPKATGRDVMAYADETTAITMAIEKKAAGTAARPPIGQGFSALAPPWRRKE